MFCRVSKRRTPCHAADIEVEPHVDIERMGVDSIMVRWFVRGMGGKLVDLFQTRWDCLTSTFWERELDLDCPVMPSFSPARRDLTKAPVTEITTTSPYDDVRLLGSYTERASNASLLKANAYFRVSSTSAFPPMRANHVTHTSS